MPLPASSQPDATSRLAGVVVHDAGPLPGVIVRLIGAGGDKSVVTNQQGQFEMGELKPGAYVVTARLTGFRVNTTEVVLAAGATRELRITLPVATLSEVLWVAPGSLREAYATADAIAHLRIESTARPAECSGMVSTTHQARVLAVLKAPVTAAMPATIQLEQETAGTCLENGERVDGVEQPPYAVNEEYIGFLVGSGGRYSRLAGRVWALRVRGGRVDLPDYVRAEAGQDSMTVTELADALRRLAQ